MPLAGCVRSMDERQADTQRALSDEELAAHEAADLPEREAMTLVDPSTVLGGSSLTSTPTSAPATGVTPPVSSPPISVPNLSSIPTHNPGGTYQPDASASSQTTS
jgi:hypothetical protein